MIVMTANHIVQSNQNIQSAKNQLTDLIVEAKKVTKEIDKTNKESNKEMDVLEVKAIKSIKKVQQIQSDLDRIEEKAGEELNKLASQQTED
ncbi:MAG: hypothetical protein A3I29_00575 [Candidatus Magasanikbacteria bacterium RIFCSPLOWO2_02_FULL_44_11]|uniref:Uncharacterized protein n=2 Tax=Candidatus Magasanikiibacteriota TaxID=1752731 RepID=A0A1F6N9N7_9BACT|nr:MAG: hypothetical protein A3D53_03835 [Candidatus Magasanikbacteria bacterium RIFCSPHIGHO2_02_FULL_45_10]OGH80430.1 MAG: hypothetical protein A3I29_00575 [Candidatus Magasanikbacteria bacterium RIFCSPLOWO2_02_FULL_44_11]